MVGQMLFFFFSLSWEVRPGYRLRKQKEGLRAEQE